MKLTTVACLLIFNWCMMPVAKEVYILAPCLSSQNPELKHKIQTFYQKNYNEFFTLDTFAKAIADGDEKKQETCLNYFKEAVRKRPDRVKDIILLSRRVLDFTNSSMKQVYINSAVLYILAEIPAEYKKLEIVLTIAKFIEYKGEGERILRLAGLAFFKSIPDEYMFSEINKKDSYKNIKFELRSGENKYYQEISQYPLLSHIGEIKSGVLMRLGEDDEKARARERMITSNLGLCFYTVNKFFYWSDIDNLTLVTEGNFGLIEAVDKYDPCLGDRFSTYAIWWIRQSILRHIDNCMDTIRLPVYVHDKIRNLSKRCRIREIDPEDNNISDEEISRVVNISTGRIRDLRELMRYHDISIHKPLFDEYEREDKLFTLENILSNNPDEFEEENMYDDVMEGVSSNNPDEFEEETVDDRAEKILKQLNGIFRRVEEQIKKRERPKIACKMIDILRKRLVPMMLQNHEEALMLYKLGEEHRVTGELMRQYEKKLIENYMKRIPVSQEERNIIDRLLEKEAQYRYSLTECLNLIYKKFAFEKFKSEKLFQINERFTTAVKGRLLMTLKNLCILKSSKKGFYKIWSIFKDETGKDAEGNIAFLCNISLKMGDEEKPMLGYHGFPEQKIPAAKERIKMEFGHRFYKNIQPGKIREACTIRVWNGYVGESQKDLLQYIRKKSEEGTYKVEFQEIQDFDMDETHSGNELRILPFSRLTEGQKEKIRTSKTQFINMDFEKESLDPFAIVQIEAVVAAGIAYLNDDDFAFNNLYKLLTNSDEDISVSIKKLKQCPDLMIKYVFILEATAVPIDDLKPLNERMKKLVTST